jgi:Right handed beta helix region
MKMLRQSCNIFSVLKLSLIILVASLISACSSNQLSFTRDCQRIQSAIDKLPIGGGEVRLAAATYECKKPIVMKKDNVRLRGQGSATLLRLADNINAPVIVMGSDENVPSFTTRNLRVSELHIDGNRRNQTIECMGGPCETHPLRNNGISIRRCVDCIVDTVTVQGAISGGLVTELGCRNLLVRNYTSFDNEFDGLAGYETENSNFMNIKLFNNKGAGISTDIKFNNNHFYDVFLEGNKTVGIFMRDSINNIFTNLHITDTVEHGIFLAQVDTDETKHASGNKFNGVVISRSGGSGIRANDASCVNNTVTGQFVDNKHGCIGEVSLGLVENNGAVCM